MTEPFGLRHIVYIDDDEEDRALFCEGLHELDPDMRITIFESGYDLIAFLQEQAQVQPLPCAIISDMHMPLMNGIELLTILKAGELWSNIPVAIFTTSSAPNDARSSIGRGAVGFFSKPATFTELKTAIAEILTCCHASASGTRTHSQSIGQGGEY